MITSILKIVYLLPSSCSHLVYVVDICEGKRRRKEREMGGRKKRGRARMGMKKAKLLGYS